MGMVFVVDRLKEILKVRGFQVAPAELEGHLLGHPFVTDVCVVGAPDEFSGEAPMAFVVPSSKAKRLIKTGPRGVSEVKVIISKASLYHSTGVFLDVNQSGLTDSTSRMPRFGTNISQGGLSLWIPFQRIRVGSFCAVLRRIGLGLRRSKPRMV